MKLLLLFGPLLLSGCAALPVDEHAIAGRCERKAPEVDRRRDRVKGTIERIRVINLTEHCRLRSFRVQCEWIWQ